MPPFTFSMTPITFEPLFFFFLFTGHVNSHALTHEVQIFHEDSHLL